MKWKNEIKKNIKKEEGSFIYDLHIEKKINIQKMKKMVFSLLELEKKEIDIEEFKLIELEKNIIKFLLSHYAEEDLYKINNIPQYSLISDFLNDLEYIIKCIVEKKEIEKTFLEIEYDNI